MNTVKKVGGGVTRAKGFLSGSIYSGVKRKNEDLCLIVSENPARATGLFTQNRIKAAPIILTRKNLRKRFARAIIANSGNANCLTGRAGLKDADSITCALSDILGIDKDDVLTASTGIIGKRLPVEKIIGAVGPLVKRLGRSNSTAVAKALMTTDRMPKEYAVSFKVGSRTVNIGAVAKGAGMIHPDLATMLCFITTDAEIYWRVMDKALRECVESTFNRITIDGDMSTNDCVLMMSNGMAKNRRIRESGADYGLFKSALKQVCSKIAEMMVRDAEGATKFIKIEVRNARNAGDAEKAAYAVATSPLVKTAAYGSDPNWGRVAAAVGRSGAYFNPEKLDIILGKTKVLGGGEPLEVDKKKVRRAFSGRDLFIMIDMHSGKARHEVFTSDLSKRYVEINSHYSS